MRLENDGPVKPRGFFASFWRSLNPTWKSVLISLALSVGLSLAFRNVVFLFIFFAFPFGRLFGRKK